MTMMVLQQQSPNLVEGVHVHTASLLAHEKNMTGMAYGKLKQLRRQGRRHRQQQGSIPMGSFLYRALLMALLALAVMSDTSSDSFATTKDDANLLSQDSVVMIVGATTSLLGSEVALALYRLFDCQVVLIDDLSIGKSDDRLAEGLSALEFHRQSLFRVWQEIDNHLTVYRMSPRTIIPDIDPGTTVDRLAHVFDKHQPTHLLIFPEAPPETYRADTDDAPPRAGVLESLLEQVRSFRDKHPEATYTRPHVLWTSSEEIYPNQGVWSETMSPPIPRTKLGGDAMMNEIMAKAYDEKGVPSAILRVSKYIYGPFHDKSSPLFSIIENMLRGEETKADPLHHGDYLYVDDAVDAVLAALQLPHVSHTYVMNVASGNPIRTMEQMAARVQSVASGEEAKGLEPGTIEAEARRLQISLAEQVLNFSPRVSLTEGLQKSIAWHYDRMNRYDERAASLQGAESMAQMHGVASCSDSSDTECLRGSPILPCASECAHRQQCRKTGWDNLLPALEAWTATCNKVLYEIRRSSRSKVFAISPNSKSQWSDAHCNIAFVPSATPEEFEIKDNWTIVPVPIKLSDVDSWLVPLWSPGKLFPRSKWAIYKTPNVAWNDLDQLMEAVHMQPEGEKGQTALLIGMDDRKDHARNVFQRDAYRAIHIKATQIIGTADLHDPFFSEVDAQSWMVHRLGNFDSEQLRCDISKEIGSWKGVVDFDAAAAFVFGLHDLWTQVLLREKGQKPWWHGSSVVTVPSTDKAHRRLQEKSVPEDNPSNGEKDVPHVVADADAGENNIFEEVDTVDEEDSEDMFEDVHHFDHNGFGVTRQSVGGAAGKKDVKDKEDDEEESPADDDDIVSEPALSNEDKLDPSKYDTWLGVLSSTDTRMFVRLVDPKLVGTVFMDEYESSFKKIE